MMPSPFRPRSVARTPKTPGSVQLCERHPRFWVKRKVFLVTRTRSCPYCELESYTSPTDPSNSDSPVPPPEPGFGGYGELEEPEQLLVTPGAPSHRSARTPESGRTAVFKPSLTWKGGSKTPGRLNQRLLHGGGSGTTQQGHSRGMQSPQKGNANVTQERRASRGYRRSMSESFPSHSATTPFLAPDSPGLSNPSSMSRSAGNDTGKPSIVVPPVPHRRKEALGSNSSLRPPPHPVIGNSMTPGRPKSLRFTSAARKRSAYYGLSPHLSGITGTPRGAGALSAAMAHDCPPSPTGSTTSDFGVSTIGYGLTPRYPRRASGGDGFGYASGAYAFATPARTRGKDEAFSRSSESATSPPSSAGSSMRAGLMRPGEYSTPSRHSRAMFASGAGNLDVAGNGTTGMLGMVEGVVSAVETASPDADNKVLPIAMAIKKLAEAVEHLRPEHMVGVGWEDGDIVSDSMLKAADEASAVVKSARELTHDDVSSSKDDGHADAAGAILADAGQAVELLSQTARAFAWGIEELSSSSSSSSSMKGQQESASAGTTRLIERVRQSRTFGGRFGEASEAVEEAAERVESLLAVQSVSTLAPREAAALQRRWLAVMDRHEAWTNRNASKASLLIAEQEIAASAVAVFEDCRLQGEETFGKVYAAEYLRMPVSVSILDDPAVLFSKNIAKASYASNSKPFDVRAVRTTAVVELRDLASLLPASHARLVRTHGVQMITATNPMRMLNGSEAAAAAAGDARRRAEPPALVLVSELVEGGTLRHRLAVEKAEQQRRRRRRQQQHQHQSSAVEGASGESDELEGTRRRRLERRRALADIAAGLSFLHGRGVAHGALSTENVVLGADGRAKICFYGLSKTRAALTTLARNATDGADDSSSSANPSVVSRAMPSCVRAYTPPETLLALKASKGKGTGDARAVQSGAEKAVQLHGSSASPAGDSYAFGMLAWEVLTGRHPWEELSSEEISQCVLRGERPDLSIVKKMEGLDGFYRYGDLLKKLWNRNPAERPAMRDVARVLRPVDLRTPSVVARSVMAPLGRRGSFGRPSPRSSLLDTDIKEEPPEIAQLDKKSAAMNGANARQAAGPAKSAGRAMGMPTERSSFLQDGRPGTKLVTARVPGRLLEMTAGSSTGAGAGASQVDGVAGIGATAASGRGSGERLAAPDAELRRETDSTSDMDTDSSLAVEQRDSILMSGSSDLHDPTESLGLPEDVMVVVPGDNANLDPRRREHEYGSPSLLPIMMDSIQLVSAQMLPRDVGSDLDETSYFYGSVKLSSVRCPAVIPENPSQSSSSQVNGGAPSGGRARGTDANSSASESLVEECDESSSLPAAQSARASRPRSSGSILLRAGVRPLLRQYPSSSLSGSARGSGSVDSAGDGLGTCDAGAGGKRHEAGSPKVPSAHSQTPVLSLSALNIELETAESQGNVDETHILQPAESALRPAITPISSSQQPAVPPVTISSDLSAVPTSSTARRTAAPVKQHPQPGGGGTGAALNPPDGMVTEGVRPRPRSMPEKSKSSGVLNRVLRNDGPAAVPETPGRSRRLLRGMTSSLLKLGSRKSARGKQSFSEG